MDIQIKQPKKGNEFALNQTIDRGTQDLGEKREHEKEKTNKDGGKGISFFAELVKIVLLALLIIVPIRTFIFQPFFVQGASMEPNFHDGEYLIINELGYKKTVVAAGDKEFFTVDRFKDLQRGDPVVFRYPRNPKQFFIKRIVGLPGETVHIKNGSVTIINDEYPEGLELNEKEYLPSHVETTGKDEFVLGDNEYVVLGDNRSHSSDSRTWGALSGELIVGKVLLRAWPFSKFSFY
jgi:signal peptidase I